MCRVLQQLKDLRISAVNPEEKQFPSNIRAFEGSSDCFFLLETEIESGDSCDGEPSPVRLLMVVEAVWPTAHCLQMDFSILFILPG